MTWTFSFEMYQFPLAAVMNYHKFSGLKAREFIRLAFCRLEVQQDFLWVKIKASERLFVYFWRL